MSYCWAFVLTFVNQYWQRKCLACSAPFAGSHIVSIGFNLTTSPPACLSSHQYLPCCRALMHVAMSWKPSRRSICSYADQKERRGDEKSPASAIDRQVCQSTWRWLVCDKPRWTPRAFASAHFNVSPAGCCRWLAALLVKYAAD